MLFVKWFPANRSQKTLCEDCSVTPRFARTSGKIIKKSAKMSKDLLRWDKKF